MKNRKYTDEEINTIKELYLKPGIGSKEISEKLNRSQGSIKELVYRLQLGEKPDKIPRSQPFTKENDLLLQSLVHKNPENIRKAFELFANKTNLKITQAHGRWYNVLRKKETMFATVGNQGLKNTKNIRRGTDIPKSWYITINDQTLSSLSIAGDIRNYKF